MTQNAIIAGFGIALIGSMLVNWYLFRVVAWQARRYETLLRDYNYHIRYARRDDD